MNNFKLQILVPCLLIALSACSTFELPDSISTSEELVTYAEGSSIVISAFAQSFDQSDLSVAVAEEGVVEFVRTEGTTFRFAALSEGTTTLTFSGGDAADVSVPIKVKRVTSVSLTTRNVFLDEDVEGTPVVLQGQMAEFGLRYNGAEDLQGTSAVSILSNYIWTPNLVVRDAVILDSDELGTQTANITLHSGEVFPIEYRVVAESDVMVAVDAGSEAAARANSGAVLVRAHLQTIEGSELVHHNRHFVWQAGDEEVANNARHLTYQHSESAAETTLTISKGSLSETVVVRGDSFEPAALQ